MRGGPRYAFFEFFGRFFLFSGGFFAVLIVLTVFRVFLAHFRPRE